MDLPTHPVRLEAEQVEDLARHFSAFRHDINGCLALVVAATELIRYNASVVTRMAGTLIEQPSRIAGKAREFAVQCERVLGLRKADQGSWYLDLWKLHNASTSESSEAVTVTPEAAKRVHGEVLLLAKELTHLGFSVSGAASLTAQNRAVGEEAGLAALDQVQKVSKKFTDFVELLEGALQVRRPPPKPLLSGAPTGAITLSPDQVALFHRRLENLQRDLAEHLAPLVELSRLARENPSLIPARAQEFSLQPPKLSEEVARFATEFDRTFGIVRQSM